MNQVTPQLRKAAELLLTYEAWANLEQATKRTAAFLVCERLRPPLSTLMGSAGFRALLLRALTLVSAETSWTGVVKVKVDGSLEGWNVLESRVTRKEFAEVSVSLIARLFSLLVAFIGEELTFRQLREIWPDVTLNN
jgi:hypothetical protein